MQTRIRRLTNLLLRIALLVGLVVVAADRAGATASSGACCQPSNACVGTDEFSCEQGGGTYFGDGTTCANIRCGVQTSVPMFSLLGLVGVIGALGGLGLFRLVRPQRTASGTA